MRGRPLAAFSLIALWLAAGVSPVLPAWTAELSEDVRRRLAAGEVVVTDTLPPGGSKEARGGTAMARMRAAPEAVWRVIVDYPGHPRYYPRVTAAEVVESDERHVIVRYDVAVSLLRFTFYMDKQPDARRRRVEWQLAEGRSNGLFRENSGYWQVDPSPDRQDASVVIYAIAVRTKLPGFLTGDAERDSLVDTVTALRKLVEAQR